MAALQTLNDLRYEYYAGKLGIPLTEAVKESLADLEYRAIESGALDSGGTTGAPDGPAGGSLAGFYPNPTLAINSVNATHIVDGSVGTTELADGSVTNAKLAPNSVNSTNINQNQVSNLDLVDVPTQTIKGRVTAATGDPEDLTPAQTRTVIASDSGGGTTNFLRADGTWAAPPAGGGSTPTGPAGGGLTGTYPDPTLANNSVGAMMIVDGSVINSKLAVVNNNTIKGRVSGGVNFHEDLTPAQTRQVIASDSGGGTTNYLRADGTWAAPSGSGTSLLTPTALKAGGTYNAAAGELVLVDLRTSSINVVLPTNPPDNTQVGIYVSLITVGQTNNFSCTPVAGSGDFLGASNLLRAGHAWATYRFQASTRNWFEFYGITPSQTPRDLFSGPAGDLSNNNKRLISLADPISGTDALNLQTGDARYSANVVVQAVQTASFTATAQKFWPVSTSSGNVTATLPATPVDNDTVIIALATAGNTLTVNASHPFNASGGSTTRTLTNAGQVLFLRYSQSVWYTVIDPAPSLNDGTYTYLDTSTPGVVKTQLNDEIGASSLILLDSNTKIMSADYLMISALPTCNYVNGVFGVGATLTSVADGALPTIDGITPAVNDTVLIVGQTAALQNGLYNVTQVGDASNPWILTRDNNSDHAGDMANGVLILIAKGSLHAGRMLRFKAMTYTIGTTGQNPQSAMTIGDLFAGPDRLRLPVFEDFGGFNGTVAITSSLVHIPGVRGFFQGSGGAGEAVVQSDLTAAGGELVDGCAALQTGTTATGRVVYTSHGSAFFDVTKRYELYGRLKVPTVSDGTNTFNVKFGLMSTTDGAPTDGVYWEAISGTANWQAVARVGGVSANNDTGVVYNTAIRSFILIIPGDGKAYFYNGATLVATITTGFPANGSVTNSGIVILKSAGTAMREVRVDVFSSDITQQRTLFVP